jgi:predicted SAM-dependent methyltransferase
MKNEYIQFGCGLCAPTSWLNFDAGPAFWLQQKLPFLKPVLIHRGFPDYPKNISYGDVVKGLPVKASSAKAVYSSHVLEHLALDEFRTAVRNCFHYLQSGGRFRLVVPDLEYLAKSYLADTREDPSSRFMEASHLGEIRHLRGLSGMSRAIFGRSKHYWMWDYKTLKLELLAAGFVDIRRAQFGDSDEPRFKEVESISRWESCLGVECRRQ